MLPPALLEKPVCCSAELVIDVSNHGERVSTRERYIQRGVDTVTSVPNYGLRHGGYMPPQPEIDDLPPVSPRDIETYTRWRQVCELVHAGRASGLPTVSNDLLARTIAADPKDTLAPFFQLWLADNFLLAGDLRSSIAAYRQLHDNYSDRRFCGEALGAIGLQSAAQAHARLGEVREAIATLAEAAESYVGACYPATLAYTAGCMAERANLLEEAMEAFTTATKAEDPFRRNGERCRDLAERCLRRLQSKRSWVRPSAHALAEELSTALSERNADALKALASLTHFSVAALGSERGFIDAEPVLVWTFSRESPGS